MSRPREFDVDRALHQCMEVFWTKGFKSTSFEDLTRTTLVKKQSLYCVFEDKRTLFLKALALYREQSVSVLEELVTREVSPWDKLMSIRDIMLCQGTDKDRKGCLMVNSVLEFGPDDEEVTREIETMSAQVERILEQVVRSGQEQRMITSRHTSRELAAYLHNALLGAQVMKKSGASRERIDAALHLSFAMLAP